MKKLYSLTTYCRKKPLHLFSKQLVFFMIKNICSGKPQLLFENFEIVFKQITGNLNAVSTNFHTIKTN